MISADVDSLLEKHFPREIIKNFPGLFYLIDEKRRFLRWNLNEEKITGYSSEELYGMDALLTITEEDRDVLIGKIKEAFEQGNASVEVKLVTKGGKKTPFFLSGSHFEIQGLSFILGVGLETSKLKVAEEEVCRRKEELEAIVSVSQAMRVTNNLAEFYQVILKQVSDLLEAGGAALALFDPVNQQSIVELGYRDWIDWKGRYFSPRKERIGQIFLIQDSSNLPEGFSFEWFHSLTSVAVIPLIVKNNLLGSIWVGRTVPITQTDLRLLNAIGDMAANAIHRQQLFEDLEIQLDRINKTKAVLIQNEKLAAIGELVAGVAHELNNPLTSIILYSRTIQQHNSDSSFNRDLDVIVRESQRAAKIVRGLLDFSRQYSGEKKPLLINDVLNASLGILSYELNVHDIYRELSLDPNLPFVLGDAVQLQQVFINLINNAIQAISAKHQSGFLRISANLMPSKYLIEGQSPSNVICIVFQNDGPEIASDILPRIFDPFFTTKPEGIGTGLGLSICHGIITEHAGHIWAENNPEGGVSFFIELPVISSLKPEEQEIKTVQALPVELTKRANILVIDDEPGILEIIGRLLKRNGYDVDTINDGKKAFVLLDQKEYDLILCDIRMPEMSGPELFMQLQEKYPGMARRIVFTTGDLISPSVRQFFEKSGVSYLSKPFEVDQLIKCVQTALSSTSG